MLKIKLEEPVRTPYNLQSVLAHDPKTGVNDASLVWNEETDYFFDDFENYTSFLRSISLRGPESIRIRQKLLC